MRIIYLRDLKEKDDISDWLEINRFKKNRFEKLILSETKDCGDLDRSMETTNKPSIDALNEEFAVLTMGNKVLILWEKNDEERFLPVQDFRVKLKNKWVDQQKASEYFLEHPKRREYSKIDLLPGINHLQCLQSFKGFPIKKGGLTGSHYFMSSFDVSCSGNEK